MVAERTTQRTVTGQGRPVLYYNVWRFDCPQGCATTTFDFSEASLDPQGMFRPQRLAAETGSGGELVVAPPSLLDRLDLSYLITVVGFDPGLRDVCLGVVRYRRFARGQDHLCRAADPGGLLRGYPYDRGARGEPAAATVPSAVEDPAAGAAKLRAPGRRRAKSRRPTAGGAARARWRT